jgi:hypothetical protein
MVSKCDKGMTGDVDVGALAMRVSALGFARELVDDAGRGDGVEILIGREAVWIQDAQDLGALADGVAIGEALRFAELAELAREMFEIGHQCVSSMKVARLGRFAGASSSALVSAWRNRGTAAKGESTMSTARMMRKMSMATP